MIVQNLCKKEEMYSYIRLIIIRWGNGGYMCLYMFMNF